MATQLLALPAEILDEIWSFLDKKTLKELRSTSHACEGLSTQPLFHSYTIYPHVRSFERLVYIAETPHLAIHVHQMRYNTLFIGLLDMISARIKSVWSKDITLADRKLMLDNTQAEKEQVILAGRTVDEMTQLTYLQRAFACLLNLEDIKVIEGSGMDISLLPTKYAQRYPSFYREIISMTCGRFEHTRLEKGMIGPYYIAEQPYSRAVIMAGHCLPKPLKALRIQGVTFDTLFYGLPFKNRGCIFDGLFRNLRKLTIDSPSGPALPHSIVVNVQSMLEQMTSLEELTLIFRRIFEVEVYDRQIEDIMSDICVSYFEIGSPSDPKKLPARLTWSTGLRKLTLGGLVCTEKEFQNILKQCAKSLTSLRLMYGIVIVPESRDEPRACLVRVLKWIRKHLSLKYFQIGGLSTNGGMQFWNAPETLDSRLPLPLKESLYAKVTRFVVDGGECPLEHLAIPAGYHDLHKRSHSAKTPETLYEPEFEGDSSWTMEYRDEMDDNDDISEVSDDDLDPDSFDEDELSEDDFFDEGGFDDIGFYPPYSVNTLSLLTEDGIPALHDSLD